MRKGRVVLRIFVFNDTATTEMYTRSLHDALPIWIIVLINSPVFSRMEANSECKIGVSKTRNKVLAQGLMGMLGASGGVTAATLLIGTMET